MTKQKILITVTTYPLPSRSYDELVCTAGVLEDGSWIRIYPVPFKFLSFRKYQWVELEIRKPHKKDFRPESHSPVHADLSDLKLIRRIETENEWAERKEYCLKKVYTSIEQLIKDSKDPKNTSLATFKPAKILDFIVEEDEEDWKKEWLEQLKQLDLFTNNQTESLKRNPIRKVPYKFKYHIKDENGKESKMMIEDWEIGALYWNCLKNADGNRNIAISKVREKYFDEFSKKDIYLFLGTTSEGHRRRFTNPFVIIGVFYPPHPKSNIQVKQGMLPF